MRAPFFARPKPGAVVRRGTSLPELVMVLTIVAILLAFARPALRDFFDRAAVASATGEVVAVIGAARHTAIVEGRFVAVHFDSSSSRMLTVSVRDTLQRRDLKAVHGVGLAATRDSIAFAPTGRATARRTSASCCGEAERRTPSSFRAWGGSGIESGPRVRTREPRGR